MSPRSLSVGDVAPALVAAGALLLDGAVGPNSEGLSALAVPLALATATALVLRKWRPLPVLVAVCVGIVACLFTFKPTEAAIVPGMIALYAVAVQGDRRRSVVVGLAMAAFVGFVVAVLSPDGLLSGEGLSNVSLALLALMVGDAVRSRREVLAGLRERAERAEQTREEEAKRRVSEERLRIARDLHDVVAHHLVAINVQAGVAAHMLGEGSEPASSALALIKRVSGEALTDLRGTLGVLRDDEAEAPTAPPQGLGDIGELVAGVRAAGLEVHMDVFGQRLRVPAPVDAAGYRIVQEALTNVLRHANARRADLRIAVDETAVEIDVLDDGVGARDVGAGGHGLIGMRERAAAVGGQATASVRPEGGWRVHALLPLPR